MAENDWDLAKIPLQNFWSADDLDLKDQSKKTPSTLGEKFSAGSSAGAYGLEANINYLDAAFQAITGDQEELDESLDRARLSQEIAAEYMEDLTPFDEFWEEPTVDGFLEQAAIGLGQFFPSGLASIAAATTGAAVGLVAGPTTAAGVGLTAAAGVALKQGLSKGSMKLAKNILRESLEKRAKKVQMSKDDFAMAEASHALTKMQRFKGPMGAGRNAKFGALAGAGTQEYTQGAGITFGEFADQDMTGAREAAISFGVGVPYAAVGLGAEFVAAKAVLTPLLKEATKKAARRGPQSSGYKKLVSELGPLLKAGGKGVAIGGTVGALSEGSAEVVQETMTGIQKLAIDPDYTPAELKMNLIEAAFKGAIGGAGMSGAGRGVTQMARELIDTTQNRFMEQGDLFGADEQINKKLSDALKIKDVIARRQKAQESIVIKGTTATTAATTDIAFPDLDTSQMDFFDMVPEFGDPQRDSVKNVGKQLNAMLDSDADHDSVWVPEGHMAPSQAELDKIFGDSRVYTQYIPGQGRIYSLVEGKANYVKNQEASAESLAQVLGLTQEPDASHDRVVTVQDKDGNIIRQESTNAQNESNVIENFKEKYNKTEKGKATYQVDEQARYIKDVQELKQEQVLEELESGYYLDRAVEEFNNVLAMPVEPIPSSRNNLDTRTLALSRLLERYKDNYVVLKTLHNNLLGKTDETSIAAKEAIAKLIMPIYLDIIKRNAEELGTSPDLEAVSAIAELESITAEQDPKEQGMSAAERISSELEARDAREQAEEEVEVRDELENPEASAAQVEGMKIIGDMTAGEFDQVSIVGKNNTINQEAEPWLPSKPTKDEMANYNSLRAQALTTMTPGEQTAFLALERTLSKLGAAVKMPSGLLTEYIKLRKARPNDILKVKAVYKEPTLTAAGANVRQQLETVAEIPSYYKTFNVLDFFVKSPDAAIAGGLAERKLAFVIETQTSPEEIRIEYDDQGSKIKGRLTIPEYFERIIVEAGRSQLEFKNKSGWVLVSPKEKNRKPEKIDFMSMIYKGRAIVAAEGNYVPGDFANVRDTIVTLLAVANENGYNFRLGNKSIFPEEGRESLTYDQLLNSKALVYRSNRTNYTLGDILTYALENKSSYGDMLAQSASLVEAISNQKGMTIEQIFEEVKNIERSQIEERVVRGTFKNPNQQTYTINDTRTAIVPNLASRLVASVYSPFNRPFPETVQDIVRRRDDLTGAEKKVAAKNLIRNENLFVFKELLEDLYDVAEKFNIDAKNVYDISYQGEEVLDDVANDTELNEMMKSTIIRDNKIAGADVSNMYELKAETIIESNLQYVTEYKNRQYSSGTRNNITTKTKPKFLPSPKFKKRFGTLQNRFEQVVKQNNYFGISQDVYLMTTSEFESPRNKLKAHLQKIYPPLMQKKLKAAYFHRKKQKTKGTGLTIRATKTTPWIIIIDDTSGVKTPKDFRSPELKTQVKTDIGTLAHEIGHVIMVDAFDSALFKNSKFRENLITAFKKDRDTKNVKAYFGPNGIYEWMADQEAGLLIHQAVHGKLPPAKNAIDSFFKKIAQSIIKAWNQITSGLGTRIDPNTPNEAFVEFHEEVVRLAKEGAVFEAQEGKPTWEVQNAIYDMVEETAQRPYNMPEKTWALAVRKIKEIISDLQETGGVQRQTAKLFRSADGFANREEFGEPGKQLARFFYQRSATATGKNETIGYNAAQVKSFNMLMNKLAIALRMEENASPFFGLSQMQEEAILLANNDTITDSNLLDVKVYGEAGAIASDLRKFLREDVFFKYLMQTGKNGNPVLKNMKLTEQYLTPGDQSTRVSYFTRQWDVIGLRSDQELRDTTITFMANKIVNRELVEQRDDKTVIIEAKNYAKEMKADGFDAPLEGLEFGTWWASKKLSQMLSLPMDELLSENIQREIGEDIDLDSMNIGFPSQLARTFAVQVLPDLDGVVDENGEPVMKRYGMGNQELSDLGVLVDGQTALINYLRTSSKKFEFEDRGGMEYLESLIEQVPTELQPHLRGAARAMLGKLNAPMDKWFQRINSYGLFINIVTTLTFAVLASAPDLAGPFLRSREFGSFQVGVKELVKYFDNKEDAIKFAQEIGIVTQDTLATMYINASEMDYMTAGTKQMTDAFFKIIMLEQFTKFTRVFAAGMGREFLLNTAKSNTLPANVKKRWLNELGVTEQEVLSWDKSRDFTTPEGKKVSDAIYKFVDESIIRPNSAQRPTWASNPYFALVWQLKGFFYAYGKTIMGGQGREIMNRYKEAGLKPAMVPVFMMALSVLPLTAVGLEIREFVKYALGGILPGVEADPDVFKTDDMDFGTYNYEIFDRSGMAGSWGLLLPILAGKAYGGPLEQGAGLLGPTSDKLADMFKYGPWDSRFLKEQVPFYYSVW